MISAFLTLITFVLGALVGAVLLVRWYVVRTRDPEVAQAMLKTLYRRAHPHMFQRSKEDATPVCPCCGWSETAALNGDGTESVQEA